ncbi:MAG: SPOR domain-containing protein [Rhodobacteraceae bacterium]|nr:SPOR domain-containing protein [Paracoccaceae bacterium]
MSITRIIAIAVIAGSLGLSALQAQTLRNAQPPAEFPPASFKGKQYVDSRGCIYIRAGIDGNVTWVPRVSRERKQVCGYKPTQVAGTTSAPRNTGSAPELITLPPSAQASSAPRSTASATGTSTTTSTAQRTQPASTTARRTTTTRQPVPTVASTLPSSTQTTTVRRTPTAAPTPAPSPSTSAARTTSPPPRSGGCSNASALSQRYINSGPDVRCGPQAEAPITYGSGSGIGPQSSLILTPNTRVVPRHVHDNRQNTRNVEVPEGYRTVWDDDRLNPHRTERGLRPAVLSQTYMVPAGFRPVDRGDGRLNPMRGVRTAEGDAAMAQIWTDKPPYTLRPVPTQAQVVTLPKSAARSPAEARRNGLFVASRSAPNAGGVPKISQDKYVRVAVYSDATQARQAAQGLARTGLPVRMGSMNRKGKSYRVVMAGPFSDPGDAHAALSQLHAAGYGSAKLSK